MSDAECKSLEAVLSDLDKMSPSAPLIALGQTIFWDEPMKAGVALKLKRLGTGRRFIAGIHDTDYFAKLPSMKGGAAKFRSLPHNDTTTRGLWSAAGEFSALFGSETVVTREMLATAGLRVERLSHQRPNFLDEATEAWGWRGIVSVDERPPVSAELPLKGVFPELKATFEWATDLSLSCLSGEGRLIAEERLNTLLTAICDGAEEPNLTLARYYEKLLPTIYEFAANAPIELETSTTSDLLKFNLETCMLPRFDLLHLFVNEATRGAAKASYDEAIQGSAGLYELSRFGAGAIPFDLVIPGKGRGTIRLGTRGAVIMTPKPQFLSYKGALRSSLELAELVEAKFGRNCVLVGKAVSLIGMLSREFVFVFHEGASSYVKHSRRLHELLRESGLSTLKFHPILRVKYDAWESLKVCCTWLRLPEPLQRPFGTEELCAPSFADRWTDVGREQEALLAKLGKLRRPIELIRFLNDTLGGSWNKLAAEYEGIHTRLVSLEAKLQGKRKDCDAIYNEIRELKKQFEMAERAKGRHFRERIFEREPTDEDKLERERLTGVSREILEKLSDARLRKIQIRKEQFEYTKDPEVLRAYERRQSIELESELKRCRLIRGAITSSKGLRSASVRPSAWWFPLVCPDGLWFRETVERAECYLEPLG